MSSRLALSSVLALSFALTGCPPRDDLGPDTGHDTGGVDCDLMAVASVQVSLVDSEGAPFSSEASVTYDIGEGPVDCEGELDGVVVCGWEVAGPMHIVAEAEGFGTAEVDIVVESDICHVITGQVELEMLPVSEGG